MYFNTGILNTLYSVCTKYQTTMPKPNNDNADSATEPLATNKRTAERQITKDDREEEENDDGGHPMDKTEAEPTGTFEKADAATLATRKIVKVKRPPVEVDETKKNPFAAALSKSGGSVFGSGFGAATGFGAAIGSAAGGFGTTATSGFGSTFGAAASTSAFGASPTGGSIFGKQAEGGGLAASGFASSAFATSTDPAPAGEPVLPDDVEVTNGEEGESLVHEVRAKTFELVDEEEFMATNVSDGPIPASNSIPPSSGSGPTLEKDYEPKAVEKNGTKKHADESKEEAIDAEESKKPSEETTKEPTPTAGTVKKWREVGIGPLRVLKKEHARIVQRRETAPGSLGTKLMVNIQLHQECTVTRPSEKHVQLGAIMNGKPASFLFKVKNALEGQALQDLFQREIEEAASCVGG